VVAREIAEEGREQEKKKKTGRGAGRKTAFTREKKCEKSSK